MNKAELLELFDERVSQLNLELAELDERGALSQEVANDYCIRINELQVLRDMLGL